MLKMRCFGCKEWIHSPLLLEKKEVFCPGCGKAVPVNGVYISAGPYSIYRDVLMQNLLKYRRLLMEAEKEFERISARSKTGKPDDISRGSMKKFIDQLKELLDGCREQFRAPSGDAVIECAFGDVSHKGTLVNISTSGVCVDLGESAKLPKKGVGAALRFMDDKKGDYFSLHGLVRWIGEAGLMGVRFSVIDEKSRKFLEEYIERRVHAINMPKKAG